MHMKKHDLDTPCLVIDIDILEKNLETMQARANAAGKTLRPHAKTHKCTVLAKKQLEKGAIGVCVAKVSEAEALVDAGVHGILVTGAAAVAKKAERLVHLLQQSPSLMAVVDHPANIDLLERYLIEKGTADGALRMDVLLDVDIGLRRTGVPPGKAMDLAERILASPYLRLRGIQAYAGQVQHINRYHDRKRASIESLRIAAEVFNQIKMKEAFCTIFSGTGTGTFDIDLSVPELTELQVGSYALMDAEYGAVESVESTRLSDYFRPALTMLTTVVNVSQKTHVTVDAGLKSLYRDGGRPLVVTPSYTGLQYDWFGDEYGKISPEGTGAALPPLGARLELVVSHCDPTVNQFNCFYIVRGDDVVDEWMIDLRGKSQ